LFPDEDLPVVVGVQCRVGVQDVEQDRSFVGFGSGKGEADGQGRAG
jgi:hypothetical protein